MSRSIRRQVARGATGNPGLARGEYVAIAVVLRPLRRFR